MKGILIKQAGYKLYINDIPYATTNNSPYKKLSLKNCEEIANGFDLDTLKKEFIESQLQGLHREECEKYYDFAEEDANVYIQGFKKALELVEHKLPKQTEWEVEVETEKDKDGCLILKRWK